jgi:hypothetical protein
MPVVRQALRQALIGFYTSVAVHPCACCLPFSPIFEVLLLVDIRMYRVYCIHSNLEFASLWEASSLVFRISGIRDVSKNRDSLYPLPSRFYADSQSLFIHYFEAIMVRAHIVYLRVITQVHTCLAVEADFQVICEQNQVQHLICGHYPHSTSISTVCLPCGPHDRVP